MEHEYISLKKREIPRPFSYHWGSGYIVEEASFLGRWHQPTIQLLEYEDGSLSIRFCAYGHRGHFLRSPLMVNDDDLGEMREALNDCPKLQTLLKKLLD